MRECNIIFTNLRIYYSYFFFFKLIKIKWIENLAHLATYMVHIINFLVGYVNVLLPN